MGAWIMVPRTRLGDDFLYQHYAKADNPCRQLVLLGAGLDARSWRLDGMEELSVFEVDQPNLFAYKEPLTEGEPLLVKSRVTVGVDFDERAQGKERNCSSNQHGEGWEQALLDQGFNPQIPTVWLLEGLLMYLTLADQQSLLRAIGRLSASGSAAFMDAITTAYVGQKIVVGGAPFIGGCDDYARLWAEQAGFGTGNASKTGATTDVIDFQRRVHVNRRERSVEVMQGRSLVEADCRGNSVVLFVKSVKA